MGLIRIRDHVDRWSTYDDGDRIFNLVLPEIKGGRDVTVSFDGVDAVPSAFVNAAFVRLIEIVGYPEVRAHLKITNSTKQINDLVRSRMLFAGSGGYSHT